MKGNTKKVLQYIVGFMLTASVSYCIASVLILGSVFFPVTFNNSFLFCDSYTQEQIYEQSENLNCVDPEGNILKKVEDSNFNFRTNTTPFSRIHLKYNETGNDKGYLLLNIGVVSEEAIDIRICIFDSSEEPITVLQKAHEGINIFEIPLKDAQKIRVDFLTTMATDLTIEQLKVSNQLVGVLPYSWYFCFFFVFLVGCELFGVYFAKKMKFQERIYTYITQGIQQLKEDVRKIFCFIVEHKWAFLICFGICLFAYAYNLMNFSLGVDEERDIVRSVGTIENVKELLVREGRFGLYLFRQLETVDGSFTAFVGEALAVVFIFLNIVVATKCFEVVSKGKIRDSAIVVFGGMLATLPFINAEIMCYSIMNAGVYFSMMLTTIALLLVAIFYENKRKSRICFALIFTVIALFFSEAHNVWFITGTVLINLVWVIANRKTKWSDWIKYVLHYAGLYIVSFVIYMLIRSLIGENGYATGYIQWQNGDAKELLQGIVDWIGTMLTDNNLPGAVYLLIGIFIFIGFILIYIFKEKGNRAGLILFLSVCLLITPFLLCFVAGCRMPYRTMEALILLEAGIWFVVINFIDKKLIARYVLLLTAGIIIWKQSVWMNRIFYGADLCSELDMQMGYSIGEEIEKVAETKQVEKPVVFVGSVQHSSPNIYRLDAVGQSIFFREPSRYKVYYLRYLGFRIPQASKEQIAQAEELAIDMNVWPLEGSVKEFDDVIVVKLN